MAYGTDGDENRDADLAGEDNGGNGGGEAEPGEGGGEAEEPVTEPAADPDAVKNGEEDQD